MRGILNDYSIRCVWFGRNGSYFLGYIDDDSNYKQSYYNLPSYLAKYASNRRYEIIQMLYDYETENGFIRYNHVWIPNRNPNPNRKPNLYLYLNLNMTFN